MQYRSKPPLQDVVTKRGIGSSREQRGNSAMHTPNHVREVSPPHVISREYADTLGTEHGSTHKKWLVVAMVVGLAIVGSAVGLSFMFTGATVSITPRTESSTIDMRTVATLEKVPDTLQFSWVSQERVETQKVLAEDEVQVEVRASGEISILNGYSTEPLRLIKNTRFESSDGKIFKIRDSVVVPGMKKQGEQSTPGVLKVIVYADQPGEDYNVPAGTFTIPGFEGLPQYKLVTAESAEPMSGGFKGLKRSVSQARLDEIQKNIEDKLQASLRKAIESEVATSPDKVVLAESARFTFEQMSFNETSNDSVEVSVKGTVHAVVFAREQLAKYLAGQVVPGYDGSPVILRNQDLLLINVVADSATTSPEGASANELPSSIELAIKGQVSLVWTFDGDALRGDLAGKDKSIMDMPPDQTVMGKYPGIKNAQAVVRPFWKRSFPSKPEDISVVTLLDS